MPKVFDLFPKNANQLAKKLLGWLQATLAPQLHLGVWAAAGTVDASIYLEAAAYARASVHVEVSARKRELLPPGRFLPAKPGYGGRVVSRKLNRRDLAFSGCAWLDLGVDLSGGATGKLGPLKADAILPIWSKNLQVLEVSFICIPCYIFCDDDEDICPSSIRNVGRPGRSAPGRWLCPSQRLILTRSTQVRSAPRSQLCLRLSQVMSKDRCQYRPLFQCFATDVLSSLK